MSARMLRRALKEQESQQLSQVEGFADGDEEEEFPTGNPVQNLFQLLGSEEIEDEDGDEVNVQNGGEGVSRSESQILQKGVLTGNLSKSKTKNSKGKTKNSKGKRKEKTTLESTPAIEEESVDEMLERLVLENEESALTSDVTIVPDIDPFEILVVDPRYLRAEDELRRIFGSKVINAVEKDGDGAGMLAGRKRQQPHGGGRVSLKKTLLVTPHDHWPRPEGGLSMECVDTKDGVKIFRYVASSSYQEVQKQYEKCSASHDPNAIVMLVNQHPYHIDSLLTLAELHRHMGESQRSSDLLERCLYALEYAWHPSFNMLGGRCRLDYSWDPNKPLFVALFKHMQHLYRRGCHRTALEVCKLLFSLDPDDPTGSLFCIDCFAIRAEQYKWLHRFVLEYGTDRSLSVLPSFSYSLALAQFHIEAQGSASSSASKRLSGKPSLTNPRESSLGESSLELLQQALMLHPAVLKMIVDKAAIKEDAVWTNILKHHHFRKATSISPTLEHLMNIYIARSYLVWKAPDVQAWLREGAQAVVDIAERARTSSDKWEIANWACVRKEAFPADQNEYRHLQVSDFSDSTTTLPAEQLQQFGLLGGPGNGAAAAAMRPENVMEEAAVHGRELAGRNSLMLFFQSFLPWFNHGVDFHGQDPRLQG